jgi:thioredoxin-related protein
MQRYFGIALIALISMSFIWEKDIVQTTSEEATTINWMSLNEALEAQKKNPKKIMLDAYTDWCNPCKILDRNTFQNPDVAKYVNENFYAVKFDAEGDENVTYKGKKYTNPSYDPAKDKKRNSSHQLSRVLQIRAYPTIVFFDEDANVVLPLKGYKTPQQLELYLKLIASDDYKKVKTADEWADYQKKFKYTFK